MNAKAVRPTEEEEIVDQFEQELAHMKQSWWCFLLLGLALIVCGALAVVFPFLTSVGVTVLLGAVLIVGGVATIIGAFWAGKWSGFFLQMLAGVAYTVIGFAIIDSPVESVAIITLLIAAFFVVIGIIRIIVSLSLRFPQWGWALLSGILTTLVGVIIYKNYPQSALWVIGILVAIELVTNGWYWTMLGLTLKNLPEDDEDEEE